MTMTFDDDYDGDDNDDDDDDDDNTDLKLGWTVRWRTATGNKSCPIWG